MFRLAEASKYPCVRKNHANVQKEVLKNGIKKLRNRYGLLSFKG